MAQNRLGELLVREKLISLQQLRKAQEEQKKSGSNLGYTLASGGDLTVRDDTVYLKTLGGLTTAGVVLASVYALRMFIRAVHNRVGPAVASQDIRFADGLVLVPAVLAILALALFPQLPLEKGERDVNTSITAAQEAQDGAEVATR
mgnify:CR=1 FL=1